MECSLNGSSRCFDRRYFDNAIVICLQAVNFKAQFAIRLQNFYFICDTN